MRPRQFTDEQLFETAKAVFLEHGPNVAISKVAKELGVSSAALFRRVGTKQELVRRALFGGSMWPDWIERVEQGPDDRPVREQLLEIAERIDRFFAELMPLIATIKGGGFCLHEMLDEGELPPPVRGQRAISGWFAALSRRDKVRVENPDAIAVAFLGALQARHAMRHFHGGDYPDGGPQYLPILVDCLWAGIRPKEQ